MSFDYEPDEFTPLINNDTLGLSSGSVFASMPVNPVLRLSNSNQSLNHLEGEPGANLVSKDYYALLKERIVKEFPTKYCVIHSVFVIIFCSSMIASERTQPDNFTWIDFYIISYRTLDGLILVSCLVNIFYAILAILTARYKKYFLIQLTALLSLMGCFMSFFYLIAFNIVVLVFKLLSTQCDYICITVRSVMILCGVILSILNVSFYITIQFNFLSNVNRNSDVFL